MFARNGICLLQWDIITVSLFVFARKLKTFSRRLFTQKSTFFSCFFLSFCCCSWCDWIELNFRSEKPEGDTDLETTFGLPLWSWCRVLVCGLFAHLNKTIFIILTFVSCIVANNRPVSIVIYSHHVHDPLTSFVLIPLLLLLFLSHSLFIHNKKTRNLTSILIFCCKKKLCWFLLKIFVLFFFLKKIWHRDGFLSTACTKIEIGDSYLV